jgi:hypothetical protein
MACTAAFAEEQQVPLTPQNGVPLVIIYVNETQSDIEEAQKPIRITNTATSRR